MAASGFTGQVLRNGNVPIARLIGANGNITTDQPLVSSIAPGIKGVVRSARFTNASTTPTLCAGTIYTAAAKGGQPFSLTGQIFTALSGATLFVDMTLVAAMTSTVLDLSALVLSLTTANGSALTFDVYVYGDIIA